MSLDGAVSQIKTLIEDAIRQGGTTAKNNLIRSSVPINLIHEAVKTELITAGISPTQIKPAQNQTTGELEVWGLLKKKKQDVVVTPRLSFVAPQPQAVILGNTDPLGITYTERVLSINVRSQLSSATKNFDTLYERTFAEAVNFHERCPSMVLGEVYMIAIREYESNAANQNQIRFKPLGNSTRNHVEKYIQSFELLNNRLNTNTDMFKYERVALVLVDFSQTQPKVYDNDADLVADGFLSPNSRASISNLTFDSLIPSLLATYQARFGSNP